MSARRGMCKSPGLSLERSILCKGVFSESSDRVSSLSLWAFVPSSIFLCIGNFLPSGACIINTPHSRSRFNPVYFFRTELPALASRFTPIPTILSPSPLKVRLEVFIEWEYSFPLWLAAFDLPQSVSIEDPIAIQSIRSHARQVRDLPAFSFIVQAQDLIRLDICTTTSTWVVQSSIPAFFTGRSRYPSFS